MNNKEFFEALNLLEKEKGIPKEYMYEKIKAAMAAAIKRDRNVPAECVEADFNEQKRKIRVYIKKLVAEEVMNDSCEISLSEARDINPRYQVGDYVEYDVDPITVGRIAAKIGKNVIVQAIQDAVKGSIIKEFEGITGNIITGKVRRIEKNKTAFIQYGKYEIPLLYKEQIPGEEIHVGEYIKVLVSDIRRSAKGQDILITRLGGDFIRKLFEIEVPEIQEGSVKIMAVAREAGSRTKVAVYSEPEMNIDPVGSCIGPSQTRISSIIGNLKGENIDLIKYYDDPCKFVASSLSPAHVEVEEIDPLEKTVKVSVSADKLSLAIGKAGQNVRLAAKLTGYKIDILGR